MIDPTIYAIPLFLFTMLVEHYWLKRRGGGYAGKDAAASLSGGLGYAIIKLAMRGALFGAMTVVYQHRLVDVGGWLRGVGSSSAGGAQVSALGALAYWAVLMLAEDHCYYWYHRASHQVRLLWAGHVAHHSSQHYTLATALRQSWTAPLLGPVFWLPLPLLGFHPVHVAIMSGISLIYQYWIHTELIRTLGVFEWVFNTPSHHRVHHGSNPQYIDKNHAGILIIWDRLYGTFEPEVEPVRYGLTKNLTTHNPLAIQTHEFRQVFGDFWRARGLGTKLRALFANPGAFAPPAEGAAPSGEGVSPSAPLPRWIRRG